MSDEENRQQSDTSNNSDHNYESQLNVPSSLVNHVEEEPLYAANIDDLVSAAKLGSVNTIDASFQLGDKLLPSGENILTEKNNEIDYEVHVIVGILFYFCFVVKVSNISILFLVYSLASAI
ncbi:MAG: hypothetical protein MHPSP_003062 [Paramarteilia canceri]